MLNFEEKFGHVIFFVYFCALVWFYYEHKSSQPKYTTHEYIILLINNIY